MAIKAVFFDLDGTLFTSSRQVAESTKRAIKQLQKSGIIVGIATGRGPSFVKPFMDEIGFDVAVTYNGQYIFNLQQVIDFTTMDKMTLHHLVTYATKHEFDLSFGLISGSSGSSMLKFGESRAAQIIVNTIPERLAMFAKEKASAVTKFFRTKQREYFEMMREPIYQAMMVTNSDQVGQELEQHYNVTTTRSNPYYIDIITRGNSKLQGIATAAEFYNFTLDEVMAFGDSDNDLEMLTGVGVGVGMGNASQKVKAVVDYVTDTNNKHGIAKALAHYGLINFQSAAAFESRDRQFNQVKAFHMAMEGVTQEVPKVLLPEEASHRAAFKVEEIVEFLYASSNQQTYVFNNQIDDLHRAIDAAKQKVLTKDYTNATVLTSEVDALMDLLYFTYGSLVLMGVDPYEIFKIVNQANMKKIFPDGKPHFDPVTGKLLKPDDWDEKYSPEPLIKKELEAQIRAALGKMNKK
jgi:Cof subfamily protein (haloacid dehalogenase superfamily)